jgi:[ribosomal protein S5]-alanine N-acetyltransferase
MEMFRPKTIETERLLLRPLQIEDAPSFLEIWSDPEAVRYFSFPPMESIEQAQARIAEKLQVFSDGKGIVFVIESKSDREVLGDCGIHNVDLHARRAELGYCLGRPHWGNGYMAEAVKALIAYGFEEAGLRRMEADIDPRNTPSIQLVERLGFKREGYLRKRWVTGTGEVADSVIYGLLEDEG